MEKVQKTIPFINVQIKLSYEVNAAIYLSIGQSEGIFQRYYKIIPNQYLPSGTINFYQNNLFLGQTNLANSPQNVTQILTLGNDEEVLYKIDVTRTNTSEVDGQIKRQDSDIIVTLNNKKDKSVRLTFVINASGKNLILNTNNNDNVKLIGNTISIQSRLETNEQQIYKFSIQENF